MNIVIFGKGKMGSAVAKAAEQRGHQIVLIDKNDSRQSIQNSDICIDFSHPETAIENLFASASAGKNMVMGTTGWYDKEQSARTIVADKDIGFLWAANFSLGVWLFTQAAAQAAQLFNSHPHYDAAISETHHNQKVDAPSGTAKVLRDVIVKNFPRKKSIDIASIRCGANHGKHEIIFDAPSDTITMTHQSHNRDGFALGAVIAAEWLHGKKGYYTLDDMMRNL